MIYLYFGGCCVMINNKFSFVEILSASKGCHLMIYLFWEGFAL